MSEDSALELSRLRGLHRRMEEDLALLKKRLDALEQKIAPEPEPVAPVVPPPMPVAFADEFETPLSPEKSVFAEAVVAPRPSRPPAPEAPPLPMDRVEEQLGRIWLVRAGIVTLLTGLVFLGNMTYHAVIAPMGPGGEVGPALSFGDSVGRCRVVVGQGS